MQFSKAYCETTVSLTGIRDRELSSRILSLLYTVTETQVHPWLFNKMKNIYHLQKNVLGASFVSDGPKHIHRLSRRLFLPSTRACGKVPSLQNSTSPYLSRFKCRHSRVTPTEPCPTWIKINYCILLTLKILVAAFPDHRSFLLYSYGC